MLMEKIIEIIVFGVLCLGWGTCAMGCLFINFNFHLRCFAEYQAKPRDNDWMLEAALKVLMFGMLLTGLCLAFRNWSFIVWEFNPWIKYPLVLTSPFLWLLGCDAVIYGYLISWKKLFKILMSYLKK